MRKSEERIFRRPHEPRTTSVGSRLVCGNIVIQMENDVDHIHILVSLGTKYSVKEIVNVLKGVSARMLRRDYGETIRKYLWKDSFWNDSCLIATSGGMTLETLKKYVEEQGRPKRHYRKHKKTSDSSSAK